MSKKPSTITKKPAVDPLQNWIGEANQNEPAPAAVKEPSVASKQASQPAEATAMLSVRIPASLHKALRVHAVSESLQIQDIVSDLLREYLEKED